MNNSKINHEEQIKVVIRLKPASEDNTHSKCVYTNQSQQNQLIVETSNKKEYFLFDHIADAQCSQQTLYQNIGREAVTSSIKGYNCCIFAYGQTGAGKTYSILGKAQDLATNIYAQSRGVLPRLLNQLFDWINNDSTKCTVVCSYMEIYNQQIFDLLNTEVKVRQIRQDFKKGVFVDGLSEERPNSYGDAMQILLRGLKNRKIASTQMNSQSSRSHTIFSLSICYEEEEKQVKKIRRSKIHVVDLAGSERAKLTKVQGQRLKEGCNINKSLHVLGNVINALVQSSKKKKHIPFRDSKLTYFLKDSLGGNSITKLLANIDPNKNYMSETLSTLMFAKRAKIIKMKVEINTQNLTDNFESLRMQIKQLREELAGARYIKNEERLSQKNQEQESANWDKLIDCSGLDLTKNEKILQIFQQNELNYKGLIEVYEEHLKRCISPSPLKKQLNLHRQWKMMEKKNEALTNLVKNFPGFTKIFRQNLLLKADIQAETTLMGKKSIKDTQIKEKYKRQKEIQESKADKGQNKNENSQITTVSLQSMIKSYEDIIIEMKQKMNQALESLQKAYDHLLQQNKKKDQIIKDIKRRKSLPPQLDSLQNENEYLKLNILQLESQIARYQENQDKYQLELKMIDGGDNSKISQEIHNIVNNLAEIKKQAQEDMKEVQQERQLCDNYISKLKEDLIKIERQNKKIILQNQLFAKENSQLKKKLSELLKMEGDINKEYSNNTNTFWTNQESNFTEQFMMQGQNERNVQQKNKFILLFEKQEQKRANLQKKLQDQLCQSLQMSKQITKIHNEYNIHISGLREQIRNFELQKRQYRQELEGIRLRNRKIEQQFGKSINNIFDEYRDLMKKSYQSPRIIVNSLSSASSLKKMNSPRLQKTEYGEGMNRSYASKNTIIPKSKEVVVKKQDKQKLIIKKQLKK